MGVSVDTMETLLDPPLEGFYTQKRRAISIFYEGLQVTSLSSLYTQTCCSKLLTPAPILSCGANFKSPAIVQALPTTNPRSSEAQRPRVSYRGGDLPPKHNNNNNNNKQTNKKQQHDLSSQTHPHYSLMGQLVKSRPCTCHELSDSSNLIFIWLK